MAGGAFAVSEGGAAQQYEGRTTALVIVACIAAASGGLIFGYDIGISGGVISMDDFLLKFFPQVYRKKQAAHENRYCKYDNQGLQLFTSSLYLAAMLASIPASYTSTTLGRRSSMLLGGLIFLAGSALNAAALNLPMLILGRMLLGVGVGFGNQAVPIYLSEMAPPRLRGGLNIMFQLAIVLGAVGANLINVATVGITPWGWRLSLGLAAVPAALLTLCAAFLPDTPSSLIHRGKLHAASALLQRLRGTQAVDAELAHLVDAANRAAAAASASQPTLLLKWENRPQLAMAVLMPFFQQITGINVITFYFPVLLQSLGFHSNASLLSTVITGLIAIAGTLLSMATVDRAGRKLLLLSGGIFMFIPEVLIAIILALRFQGGSESIPKVYGVIVVLLNCVYVLAFAWSWGPLGWLVPSEAFRLETRSVGQCITVSVNMLLTFAVAQSFLTMFCHLKYFTFVFFALWVLIMTAFAHFFVPETKGVPLEDMASTWDSHWYWNKFAAKA